MTRLQIHRGSGIAGTDVTSKQSSQNPCQPSCLMYAPIYEQLNRHEGMSPSSKCSHNQDMLPKPTQTPHPVGIKDLYQGRGKERIDRGQRRVLGGRVWECRAQGRALGKGSRSAGPRGGFSDFGSALTHCLEIEGNHLTSSIPEHLGHVVGRVHACALGVHTAHLAFIIAVAEYRSWPRPLAPTGAQTLPQAPSHQRPWLQSLKDTPQTAWRPWRAARRP